MSCNYQEKTENMLNSSKLVLKACKSFKLNNIHFDVARSEINDGLKNAEINEIKSLTFSGLILASNERREDWSEDEMAEGRPGVFQANCSLFPSPDFENISEGGTGTVSDVRL